MTDLENKINSFKENLNQIIFSLIAAYNTKDNNGVQRISKIITGTIVVLSSSIELNRQKGGDSFTKLNTLLIKLDSIVKNIIKNINNEKILVSYINQLSSLHEQLEKL